MTRRNSPGGRDGVSIRAADRRSFVFRPVGAAAREVLPAIQQLLEDEDPDVRRAAAEAVRKIAGREGGF